MEKRRRLLRPTERPFLSPPAERPNYTFCSSSSNRGSGAAVAGPEGGGRWEGENASQVGGDDGLVERLFLVLLLTPRYAHLDGRGDRGRSDSPGDQTPIDRQLWLYRSVPWVCDGKRPLVCGRHEQKIRLTSRQGLFFGEAVWGNDIISGVIAV